MSPYAFFAEAYIFFAAESLSAASNLLTRVAVSAPPFWQTSGGSLSAGSSAVNLSRAVLHAASSFDSCVALIASVLSSAATPLVYKVI